MKIILLMAMSLDGKIAKNSSHFPDWTSKEDKKHFAEISREHKVLIIGHNTFKTFPAPLPGRLNFVFARNNALPDTENVMWFSGEPEEALKKLGNMGYESAVLGGGAGINTLFLKKKLIDEIMLTVEPKIFGNGISLFNEEYDANLELLDIKKLNTNSLLLKYKVNYN